MGIALQAIVGMQILMGQGIVPDSAIVKFENYQTAKQGDLTLAQVEG